MPAGPQKSSKSKCLVHAKSPGLQNCQPDDASVNDRDSSLPAPGVGRASFPECGASVGSTTGTAVEIGLSPARFSELPLDARSSAIPVEAYNFAALMGGAHLQ